MRPLSERQRLIVALLNTYGPSPESKIIRVVFPGQEVFLARQVQYLMRTLQKLEKAGLIEGKCGEHVTVWKATGDPNLSVKESYNFLTDVWIYRPRGIIFVEPIYHKLNGLIGLEGKDILHLFSGKSKVGKTCDINPFTKPDYVLDCTQKLPFEDEQFDVVLAEPPYYAGHNYGVKPYSFTKEAGRVLKIGGFFVVLHTLHYLTPKGMRRYALIAISTGPNLKARWLNIFEKEKNADIPHVKSEDSMRRMV